MLDRRTARIAEPDQFCGLVECFTGGIIEGRAETRVTADPSAGEQLAMSTRHEKKQVGEGDMVGKADAQRVSFEMVDSNKRFAGGPRDPLSRHGTDDQAADQSGAGGCRDP